MHSKQTTGCGFAKLNSTRLMCLGLCLDGPLFLVKKLILKDQV